MQLILSSNCVIVGVATLLVNALSVCARAQEFDNVNAACDAIISMHQANKARLTNAALVWTRKTHEDNFIPGRILDTAGKYEMWIDGSKVATRYLEDLVYKDGKKSKGGQRSTFVDGEFRAVDSNESEPEKIAIANDPDYHHNENYLRLIGWTSPLLIEKSRSGGLTDLTLTDVSVEHEGEDRLVVVTLKTAAQESVRQWFALNKGACLLKEQALDAKGKVYLTDDRLIQSLENGLWFPIKVVGRTIDSSTGMLLLENQYTLDLAATSSGSSTQFPDDVFTIPITKNMKVKDHRGGKPFTYTGESSPLGISELQKRIHEAESGKAGASRVRSTGFNWLFWTNIGAILFFGAIYVIRHLRRREVVPIPLTRGERREISAAELSRGISYEELTTD